MNGAVNPRGVGFSLANLQASLIGIRILGNHTTGTGNVTAPLAGGTAGAVQLTNVLIAGNTASGPSGIAPAGIFWFGGDLAVENSSITGNSTTTTTTYGVAMALFGGTPATATNVDFSNNTAPNANQFGVVHLNGGTFAATYSNFHQSGGFVSIAVPSAADGNQQQPPSYASDYTLAPGSALIDVGDPQILDADGTRSDIGFAGGPAGL